MRFCGCLLAVSFILSIHVAAMAAFTFGLSASLFGIGFVVLSAGAVFLVYKQTPDHVLVVILFYALSNVGVILGFCIVFYHLQGSLPFSLPHSTVGLLSVVVLVSMDVVVVLLGIYLLVDQGRKSGKKMQN